MNPTRAAWMLTVIATVLFAAAAARAETAAKVPVLLDTDIGSDIDDAFALALALASPEVDLRGVTTSGAEADTRAWIVCRFLTHSGHRDIPVAAGRDPQPARPIAGQFQYRHHPAPIFNRTSKPRKESAVDFLHAQLKARPGELTLVALGPLTNIARLQTEHPDCKPWIKRIIVSEGTNLTLDRKSAKVVLASGVPLVLVPASTTAGLRLEQPLRQRLFQACTRLTYQVQNLYQLWDRETPVLADPLAVALCFNERFCPLQDDKSKPHARVAGPVRGDDFLKWYVERVSAGETALPKPPPNPSKLIPSDRMPNRVHAFEDYDTDIEKRWWMSGKAETANVPPGGKRACRGVLTQDFDDRMGDMKTSYTAVIFNPVPGPPMGKQPRLRFRYWLKGTDTLRVQIYSLTNGYHRCLTLTGLPQGQWQLGTVDMRDVRKPDGSGGPLAENERIDDIQFYVDPRAEFIIDDIVLYDAAAKGERRPFPSRLLYTGTFDTGKQGKEWPGTFEIVDKQGSFWRAAKSVPRQPDGVPWIRLQLRGQRPAGDSTELFFRYRLSGADTLQVVLVNRTAGKNHTVTLNRLEQGRWAEATTNFGAGGPRRDDGIDEIHFLLPRGAELLLDDVLLYAPGQ